MRLTKFGTVWLAELGGEDSLGLDLQSGQMPLPDGAYNVYGANAVLGPRTFSRRFVLMETETQSIQAQVDALAAELVKGVRLLRAVTRDGQERQTWARVAGVTYDHRPGDLGRQALTITFEVDYPYWLASADEPAYLNDGLALDSGWVLNAGHLEERTITSSPHQWTITNSGQCPVRRGYIRVAPQAGASVQNLKVANAANGCWFQLVDTLVGNNSDVLFVELGTDTVLVNDANAYADFAIGDGQARFMVLEVGGNAITVTAGSLSGTVILAWQWSKHYVL